MKLVIAEKPSVAQSIAHVIGAYERHDGYLEGSGYIVSWCIGHLVGLAEPERYDEKYQKWRREDLPIIPEQFKYELHRDKKTQFDILKHLMVRSDVDGLICATDAGREGELIFRLVYDMALCQKPFQRLWISSMENSAIQEGFQNLKEGSDYDALYDAALCRSKADWLVGMNASRLYTTTYHQRLSVGRVQTPTLAMIVERQNAINSFQKEKYFNIDLVKEEFHVVKTKVFSEENAKRIQEKCNGKSVVIQSVEKTVKTVNPPKLFDLTSLQREANKIFGYTAKQTLDLAQQLYEKKLLTYPRTDSRYLTDDMEETARSMIIGIAEKYSIPEVTDPDVKRLLNSSKVTDHHAIIPTKEIFSQDLSDLDDKARNVLMLVASRLVCASGRKHEYVEPSVKAVCEGEEFEAKGKTVQTPGWKETERITKQILLNQSRKESDELLLPDLQEGQVIESVTATISEHFTQPPKPYTEDTLLSSMETAGNDHFDENTEKKGLGTPATRAGIIEKLISSGYVKRAKKNLLPTEAGINLIAVVPEDVKSPVLTAEWENALLQVERGIKSPEAFMQEIEDMVRQLVSSCSAPVNTSVFKDQNQKQIGICPRCGGAVVERKKSFSCVNENCRFAIWKDSNFLGKMKCQVNAKMAKELLSKGKTHVTGLYSEKKGTTFDADLLIEDTGEYVNFRLEFPKKKRG